MHRGESYHYHQQHHPRDGSPSTHNHQYERKPYNQYLNNFGDNGNNNYDVKFDKKRLFLKGVPKNLTEAAARRSF